MITYERRLSLVLALLLLVLVVGVSSGSLISDFQRSVENWTPYVITAIAGIPLGDAVEITDECDNCNGTGIIGDGRVEIVCPVCKGTGKR